MSDNNNGNIHNGYENIDTHKVATSAVAVIDPHKNVENTTSSVYVAPTTTTTQTNTLSTASTSIQNSTNSSANDHLTNAKDENNPIQSKQGTDSESAGYGSKDDDDESIPPMIIPPKRNTSAYFLFNTAMRAQFKTEYPDMSFGELAKVN